MAYKCERCGNTVEEAYKISVFYNTEWYNGKRDWQIVCKDCIEKIGHDNQSQPPEVSE